MVWLARTLLQAMEEMLSRAHIHAALDPQVCTQLDLPAAAFDSKLACHLGTGAMLTTLRDYTRALVKPAIVELSDHADWGLGFRCLVR